MIHHLEKSEVCGLAGNPLHSKRKGMAWKNYSMN